jgi:hypothetical protein
MRIELTNDLGKRHRFRGAEPGGDKTGDILDQRLLALFTLTLHRSSLAGRLVGPTRFLRRHRNPIGGFGKVSSDSNVPKHRIVVTAKK